jgi:hypothetical protein
MTTKRTSNDNCGFSFWALLDDIQEKVTAMADFFSALRERVEEAMT